MELAILKLLREQRGAFVSGEDMSRRLGVSRAAVWKHVEALRHDGYDIAAQPHLGYRLVGIPDRLLPQEVAHTLGTEVIGRRIVSYEMTGSTNDVATRLARDGAVEGTVVFAEGQRSGRGRLGRRWVSPKGRGVYCSVVLRPALCLSEVPRVTLLAAVAVARAIREVTGLRAAIRWPNDVLVHGRKVCGILTELHAEQDSARDVIVGIGINVTSERSDLPLGATSLAEEAGVAVSRLEVARAVLRELETAYRELRTRGFAGLRAAWRAQSAMLGRWVTVALRDRRVQGHAVDLDEDGALLLRLEGGTQERVTAGDVMRVR